MSSLVPDVTGSRSSATIASISSQCSLGRFFFAPTGSLWSCERALPASVAFSLALESSLASSRCSESSQKQDPSRLTRLASRSTVRMKCDAQNQS